MSYLNEAYLKGKAAERERAAAAGGPGNNGTPPRHERVRNTEAGEERGPQPRRNKTLQQLRANARDVERFGKFLKAHEEENGEDLKELGQKFISLGHERLEQEEIAALVEKKNEFLVLMERADDVANSLDTEAIEAIASESPELEDIIETGGVDAIKRALRNAIPELALSENSGNEFEELAEKIEKYSGTEKGWAKEDKVFEEAFSRMGISKREIELLMQGYSARGMAENLAEQNLGRLAKMLGKAGRPEDIAAYQSYIDGFVSNAKGRVEQRLKDVDAAGRDLAEAITATLMENPEVHQAWMDALSGRKGKKQETSGMKADDILKMMSSDHDDAEKAWNKGIAEYRATEKGIAGEEALEKFLADMKEKKWEEYFDEQREKLFEKDENEKWENGEVGQAVLLARYKEFGFKKYLIKMGMSFDAMSQDEREVMEEDHFLPERPAPDFGLDGDEKEQIKKVIMASHGVAALSPEEKALRLEAFKKQLTSGQITDIRKKFSADYTEPDKAAQDHFMEEFNGKYEDPEIDEATMETVAEEIAERETTARARGKKKGFFTDVAGAFFKKGIFEDMAGIFH